MTLSAAPTCWIIDHDPDATSQLRELLEREGYGRMVGTSGVVAGWAGAGVDCLFVRISAWDGYLHWRATEQREGAGMVIFLSGRFEKCTGHLAAELDFYLQPPYRVSQVAAVMQRRTAPDFNRRPLDFFFLKADWRYEVIFFSQLRYIQSAGEGRVEVRTTGEVYTVSGTLAAFQRRFPFSLGRKSRTMLVPTAAAAIVINPNLRPRC